MFYGLDCQDRKEGTRRQKEAFSLIRLLLERLKKNKRMRERVERRNRKKTF